MPHTAPIERFLGAVAPETGPFGLLGLAARPATEAEIDAALRRRLDRLAAHPQGASAEADEVRLALHVAVAQLKDPGVQRAMLAQLPPPPEGDRPRLDTAAPESSAPPAGFAELARATLAHSGGWNRRSQRRIAGLAHAYGIGPTGLARTLAQIAAPQSRTAQPAPSGGAPALEEPPAPAPRWLLVATALLFLASAVLLVVLILILVHRLPGAVDSTGGAQASAVAGVAPELEPAAPSERVTQGATDTRGVVDLGSSLDLLRRASSRLRESPSDAERMALQAIAAFGAGWVDADPVVVESGVAEVSSFLTAAVRTDSAVAARVADGIVAISMGEGAPAVGGLARRVYGAGLVARLSRDTFTGSVESRFRETLVRLSPSAVGPSTRSFGAGAAMALIRATTPCETCPPFERIAPEWVRVHAALRVVDPANAEVALLDALSNLMHAPFSRESGAALGLLVPVLDLSGPSSGAAIRIVGWFDDRTISTDSLAALTSELVSAGVVPGAALEVLVSASATEAERARARDALALRLGVPITAPGRKPTDRVAQAAADVLGAPIPGEPIDALRLAARAAAVHSAAAHAWVGRDDAADAALQLATDAALGARIDQAAAAMEPAIDLTRLTGPTRRPDGQWALRFVQASRNEDERARLLLELRSGAITLGPADADVLAIAALGPNPPLLRKTAQRTLLEHVDNPVVMIAVTEAIPDAVTTDDVAEMLEQYTGRDLPEPSAEDFRVEAARAAMARLLTALAPSMDRRTAALQRVIGDAYLAVLDAAADPLARAGIVDSAARGEDEPWMLAADVRASVRAEASRYAEGRWTFVRLAELDRRYAARASLPRTGLERFIVEQLAVAEMLAYLVSAERPVASPEAERVVREMEAAHISARHPFHQLVAAERAIVALWTIRFGGASEGERAP